MRRLISFSFLLVLLGLSVSCQPLPAQDTAQVPLSLPTLLPTATPYPSFTADVEADEQVYLFIDPQNGAGPLWSIGSSLIARVGEDVFVSGVVFDESQPAPNNARCVIYQRRPSGWEVLLRLHGLTREPCPIAADGHTLWVSTNPAIGNLSEPQVVRIDLSVPGASPEIFNPEWEPGHVFDSWSYRGLSVDPENHDLLVLNISGNDAQYWAYLNPLGEWSAQGKLIFPQVQTAEALDNAADTETATSPLRLAYPTVALRNRQSYVLAISDIEAPDPLIKTYLQNKGESTYVLQQIYYAWTPDVASQPFTDWIKLSDLAPAGSIRNQDIWIGQDGTAHLLWLENALDERLKTFFPETLPQVTLWHATLKDGQELSREKLVEFKLKGNQPIRARFHETEQDRLFVFYSTHQPATGGENWLMELYADGGRSLSLPLNIQPGLEYFLATGQRNGSAPSSFIELMGITTWGESVVRYIRIQIR
jgi:hypothetical protein